MIGVLQAVAVVLAAFAMAPALAHGLELPGKMRLSKEEYRVVQRIYYPGFTMAGFSEPIALIATITLLFVTPAGTVARWTTLLAVVGLFGMQAVYWIFIHPVNKIWLKGAELKRPDAAFFGFDPLQRPILGDLDNDVVWRRLRDRWEWSHVARAVLAAVALLSLVARP